MRCFFFIIHSLYLVELAEGSKRDCQSSDPGSIQAAAAGFIVTFDKIKLYNFVSLSRARNNSSHNRASARQGLDNVRTDTRSNRTSQCSHNNSSLINIYQSNHPRRKCRRKRMQVTGEERRKMEEVRKVVAAKLVDWMIA